MWPCPQARLEEGRKSVSDLARQMLNLQVLHFGSLSRTLNRHGTLKYCRKPTHIKSLSFLARSRKC